MTRRHTLAGLAALTAITGALVFGGSLAANADGGLEFTSPADGAVLPATTSPITLTGTTTNTDYTETIDVWNYTTGSPDPLCTGIDPSSGSWSCEVSLSPGAKDIRAEQGANTDILLFELRLPDPVVTGPAEVPAAGTVNLTGVSGYFGASIYAEVTDPAVPSLNCLGGVAGDGSWACNIPFDAELTPDSDVTVTVTQSYGSAVSQSVTHVFHVAAEPPSEVTLDTPVADQVFIWDPAPFVPITGRAPVGLGDVAVVDGETPLCGSPVSPTGTWSCATVSLAPGQHTLTATQGVTSDSVDVDVHVPVPSVAGTPLVAPEDDPDFAVGGQGISGYEVTATLYQGEGTVESCTAPVDTEALWGCTLTLTGLAPGNYSLEVVQRPVPADAGVTSEYDFHALTIVSGATLAPALSCAFSPNGGFQASSPYQMANFAIYEVIEEFGSSSGDSFGLQGYCNGSPGSPFPVDDGDLLFDLVETCSPGCSVSGLTPGIYEVYHTVSDGEQAQGVSFEPHSYLFTVPEAPTMNAGSSTTNSVVLTGSATPGDAIRIVRDGGSTLCSTTASGAGTWSCVFAKSTATTARAIAIDPSSGGMSAYSATRSIPVAVTPAVPPTLPTLRLWLLQFGGNLTDLTPGEPFTISVSEMPKGTEIEVWMHSTPRLLGTALGTGAPMELEFIVPEDIEAGAHEIEMIAITPDGEVHTYRTDASVAVIKPSKGEGKETPVEEEGEQQPTGSGSGSSGSGGGTDRNDPGAPSALTGSIAPVAQIIDNPVTIAVAGGLALALLFLVALPTELLNSSLSSNTSRLGRVYGAFDRGMTRAQDWLIRVTHSRAIAAALLVVIVAVIYGFVDPNFGFDVVSVRLVLSLGIALFLLSFVASWISGIIIRRAWGAIGVVAMQPTIILFAVVGVVVARILEFSPGFLVGVAIGLELLQASRHVTARAVFVQLGVVTGLALAAWVVYSLFTPGDDFVGMLVDDTMVAITAEGLTGALIAVFPLTFLDGRELWEVSKRLWVAAFLLVAGAFALLVLPTAVEGTDVADYGVWLTVFAVFGLVSLAVWLIFVRADKRAAAENAKVDA
jgi:hypothetical protein